MAGDSIVWFLLIFMFIICSRPGVALSPEDEKLLSCQGKCGQGSSLPCSCDVKCLIYNNCCEDILTQCPQIVDAGAEFRSHLGSDIQCNEAGIFIINSCTEEPFQSDLTTKNHISTPEPKRGLLSDTAHKVSHSDVFESMISLKNSSLSNHVFSNAFVTDLSTGFLYKNSSIFACHARDVSKPVIWDVIVEIQAAKTPQNLDQLEAMFGEDLVFISVPPAGLNASLTGDPCIVDSIGVCKEDDPTNDELLGTKCKTGPLAYVSAEKERINRVYNNRFCAECNGENMTGVKTFTEGQFLRGKMKFSIIMSLSTSNLKVAPATVMASENLPWQRMTCGIPSENQLDMEANCVIQACTSGFEMRPDHTCKKLYLIMFAVADDDYPLTDADIWMLPSFIKCQFELILNFEIVNTSSVSTLYDTRLNMFLYVIKMLAFLSDGRKLLPGALEYPEYAITVTTIAKTFKEYRKARPSSGNESIVEDLEDNGNSNGTEKRGQNVSNVNIVKSIDILEHHLSLKKALNGRAEVDPAKTTMCTCSVPSERFSACKVLPCLRDSTYHQDMVKISSYLNNSCHSIGATKTPETPNVTNRHCAEWSVTLFVQVIVMLAIMKGTRPIII